MRHALNLLAWVGVGVVAGCAALLLLIPVLEAPYIYGSARDVPTTTVAMVLGASVFPDGTLSPVLRERADKSAELYFLGKVKKILVTGDNSAVSHNEVNPVGNYLVAKGIPKQDIFLDHAGFDTYSSMYRARDVFEVRDLVIVSQPFHLPRAVMIARNLGLEASGVGAGSGANVFYNTVREIPATFKALKDLAFSRIPKYLGPRFPIEGEGSATWH
jgi:SanA protein